MQKREDSCAALAFLMVLLFTIDLCWFFGISPEWMRGKLELLGQLDVAVNDLAAFPLHAGQLLPARPDRRRVDAVFGSKQVGWAGSPRDLDDLLGNPLHAGFGRCDDQDREGVSSVARRQLGAPAIGFVSLDLLGPRNQVGRAAIDLDKVATAPQRKGRIGEHGQILRPAGDRDTVETRPLALGIVAGQQVIAKPVGQFLATELEGGAEGRVKGANRNAVLEVLDRALSWILVP